MRQFPRVVLALFLKISNSVVSPCACQITESPTPNDELAISGSLLLTHLVGSW